MPLASPGAAEDVILAAIRRVIRRAGPLNSETLFGALTVGDLLRGMPAPCHDPELWWRAVVDQIQDGLVRERLWADGLSVVWLRRHAGEPWVAVRDFVLGSAIPLDE